MKRLLVLCFGLSVGATAVPGAEDLIDRVSEALAWSAAEEQLRARLSGSLELEAYTFQRPAPLIIHESGGELLNPRLNLFLDAQFGPRLYAFAQARVDRGFDASEGRLQTRLDEFAFRFTPLANGEISIQIGQFGTVVGNWVARHLAWDNPFITAPLPYENLTGIFDSVAATSPDALLRWGRFDPADATDTDRGEQYRVPIVWGPSYASGAAVAGAIGKFDYAVEIKNASLSSRPSSWPAREIQWQHPTYSARLGYRPDERWKFGFSASSGAYLLDRARPTLAPGYTLDDYRQVVFGHDLAFAWRHLQIWAEVYEASFEIPRVGRARTFAYYFEVKYKFAPQFSAAVRWNQQLYGDIPNGSGAPVPWGRDVWRVDVAPTYRFTPHTALKLQYSLQSGAIGPRDRSQMLAAQFILRF